MRFLFTEVVLGVLFDISGTQEEGHNFNEEGCDKENGNQEGVSDQEDSNQENISEKGKCNEVNFSFLTIWWLLLTIYFIQASTAKKPSAKKTATKKTATKKSA